MPRQTSGQIRDAIINYLRERRGDATVSEIHKAVSTALGKDVARSSVRSYLGLNTGKKFRRVGRGTYRLLRTVRFGFSPKQPRDDAEVFATFRPSNHAI